MCRMSPRPVKQLSALGSQLSGAVTLLLVESCELAAVLSLSLLVLRILADDPNDTLATNDFALRADSLD